MTKNDLKELLAIHRKQSADYVEGGYKLNAQYEQGCIHTLEFVLDNLSSIVDDEHSNSLMQRAENEARFDIRQYFNDKGRYDEHWSSFDIENRIQRAFDEGDVETLANSFIDSTDGEGLPDCEWCENIVRDFYD